MFGHIVRLSFQPRNFILYEPKTGFIIDGQSYRDRVWWLILISIMLFLNYPKWKLLFSYLDSTSTNSTNSFSYKVNINFSGIFFQFSENLSTDFISVNQKHKLYLGIRKWILKSPKLNFFDSDLPQTYTNDSLEKKSVVYA